ncbi:hypothetical protein MIR68_008252 [Amoeboaphelidium protococcarum]|nr:hypothetical protein MIR68_008252 [Amoeboaphelidium protococcarum]KAI3643447.1 hypothetical protein MP228_013002 [Amoeboaphelidium protococcarum]
MVESQQSEKVPKLAAAVMAVMQSMGVREADPTVIHQLMELTSRTTRKYLDKSKVLANHAGHKQVELEDLQLAIRMVTEKEFVMPLPREVYARMANDINRQPLPLFDEKYGLRLPPERDCLTQPNYRLLHQKEQDDNNNTMKD